MKYEGVPVEDSVAEIFRPICPDLPTPVTTTFPLELKIASTAYSKSELKNSFRRERPSISSLKAF